MKKVCVVLQVPIGDRTSDDGTLFGSDSRGLLLMSDRTHDYVWHPLTNILCISSLEVLRTAQGRDERQV